jgi:hypothetical protein
MAYSGAALLTIHKVYWVIGQFLRIVYVLSPAQRIQVPCARLLSNAALLQLMLRINGLRASSWCDCTALVQHCDGIQSIQN